MSPFERRTPTNTPPPGTSTILISSGRSRLLADRARRNVTFEDAIEHLVFLAKVDRGLAQADAGETIPHAEAKDRRQLQDL